MIEQDGSRIDAGVLVPIYKDCGGELRLILIRRSEHGIHGGQLAFPGGKYDPQDESLLDTALRETKEEVGLSSEQVKVLGQLPAVDTMTSNFRVHPFLARIVLPDAWCLESDEVAEIIDIPVSELTRSNAKGEETMSFPTWPKPRRVYFYMIGNHRIWGVTYRILKPLLPKLRTGEWDI